MVVMYLNTRIFNFYLLDSFTFEGLIIFVITSSPQRLVRLHLVGNTFPFLSLLVGFWVFISGGCTVLKGGFPLSRKFYVDYARAFDWLYVRK